MVELFDSAGRTRFRHLHAVFNCILQSTGSSASDVISGVAVERLGGDIPVKFGDCA